VPPNRPSASHRKWLADLDRLDALRARAFAERRPALLGRVYGQGPLLAEDTASLTRLVPSGCELHGARTRYTRPHIVAQAGAAVIAASATMAPSTLSCPGRARQIAPGAHARLRIVLRDTAQGVRIVGERAVG
jgi:hypothetical protein